MSSQPQTSAQQPEAAGTVDAAPDPLDQVSMLRSGPRLRDVPGVYGQTQALIGTCCLAGWLIHLVPRSWQNLVAAALPWWSLMLAALALAGAYWWDDRFRSSAPKRTSSKQARVLCFGSDRWLNRLRPITDDFFEPEMFNISLLRGGVAPFGGFEMICTAVSILASFVVIEVITPSRPGTTYPFFELIGIAMLGNTALQAVLRPVHLLILPGQMEIVISGPLGLGAPRVERIDLRRSQIEVRFYERLITIRQRSGPDRHICGLFVPGWARLARTLVLASVSRHDAPGAKDPLHCAE